VRYFSWSFSVVFLFWKVIAQFGPSRSTSFPIEDDIRAERIPATVIAVLITKPMTRKGHDPACLGTKGWFISPNQQHRRKIEESIQSARIITKESLSLMVDSILRRIFRDIQIKSKAENLPKSGTGVGDEKSNESCKNCPVARGQSYSGTTYLAMRPVDPVTNVDIADVYRCR
jgi:hypothetical protein